MMAAAVTFFSVFELLGGFCLVVFGLQAMAEGGRALAGPRFRGLVTAGARPGGRAPLWSFLAGCLAQTRGVLAALAARANAGLATAGASAGALLAAGVGATLTVQLLRVLPWNWSPAVLLAGLAAWMAGGRGGGRALGELLLGLGLALLGLRILSTSLAEHTAVLPSLKPWLAEETAGSPVFWFGAAALLSLLTGRSGSVFGLCLSLAAAGLLPAPAAALSLILGAHVGAALRALPLLGAPHPEVARLAAAHVLLAGAAALFAWLIGPWLVRLARFGAAGPVAGIGNLHLAARLAGSCAAGLLRGPVVALVRLASRRRAQPEATHLRELHLDKPERALLAALRELRRAVRICDDSLGRLAVLLVRPAPRPPAALQANEEALDTIKPAFHDYLAAATGRSLSRRQAMLMQHLDRCMADAERIGDHVDAIAALTVERCAGGAPPVDAAARDSLRHLLGLARELLRRVADSLDPEQASFQDAARRVLEARDRCARADADAEAALVRALTAGRLRPPEALYHAECLSQLDRLVRHAKGIALAERHVDFWIKRKKLGRVEGRAPEYEPPPAPDARDFLDRLQAEDYG